MHILCAGGAVRHIAGPLRLDYTNSRTEVEKIHGQCTGPYCPLQDQSYVTRPNAVIEPGSVQAARQSCLLPDAPAPEPITARWPSLLARTHNYQPSSWLLLEG